MGVLGIGVNSDSFILTSYPQVMAHGTPQGILDDVAMVSIPNKDTANVLKMVSVQFKLIVKTTFDHF